jgi:N-acetyl-anhydromuramyl-L-alanine amidase AmpD
LAITWLADALRAAGVTVVEHPNWKWHYRPGSWDPKFIVVHATAAPRTQSDADQVRIVRDGRSDLNGPIANACIDRQGRWHVLSAGRCNTTVAGTSGPFDGLGNTNALGIEACNDNGLRSPAEQWPEVQYNAYVKGVAVICKRMGWPASRAVGHREHTPGHKTDPTFSMTKFRADVTAAMAGRFEEDDVSQADVIAALKSTEGRAALVAALTSDAGEDALKTGALLGLHDALTRGAARTDPTGRQVGDALQGIVGVDALAEKVDAVNTLIHQLGTFVEQLNAAEVARDQADALRDAELPAKVREALGAGQSPEQVAALLRPILGANAAAVGLALQQ